MDLAVFDIDGTLVRTRHIDGVCFAQTYADVFGMRGVDPDTAAFDYSTDSGIMHQVFQERRRREPTAAEIDRFQRAFVDGLRLAAAADPRLFEEVPGAGAAIRALRDDAEWRVAIASGGWELSARFKLAHAGIEAASLPAAFASESWYREEIIAKAIERAQAKYDIARFAHVVYVGDAIWDARAARQLGLGFLGVAGDAGGVHLSRDGAIPTIADFASPRAFGTALRAAARAVDQSGTP